MKPLPEQASEAVLGQRTEIAAALVEREFARHRLCSETDTAQRLRQTSPFVGVLPPAEVWEVKSRFHHAPANCVPVNATTPKEP